jgi:putative membrane protein
MTVPQKETPASGAEQTGEAGRFAVRVSAESHFAWLRTRFALERTVMASLRTSVALIGFGFTIVQFFARVDQMPGSAPARLPEAAFYLGLSLIFCGVALLMISIWDYRKTVSYLWNKDYVVVAGVEKEPRHSPIIGIAVVLTLVGIFAFFAVLLRLL